MLLSCSFQRFLFNKVVFSLTYNALKEKELSYFIIFSLEMEFNVQFKRNNWKGFHVCSYKIRLSVKFGRETGGNSSNSSNNSTSNSSSNIRSNHSSSSLLLTKTQTAFYWERIEIPSINFWELLFKVLKKIWLDATACWIFFLKVSFSCRRITMAFKFLHVGKVGLPFWCQPDKNRFVFFYFVCLATNLSDLS